MLKPSNLLTTNEAAKYVRLSPRTLERYRVTGEGPRFLKIGRLVFYLQTALDDWLKTKARKSTSDPGSGSDSDSDSDSDPDPEC